MINLMDVITEELNFEVPKIKMANQDEVLSLKESITFLEQERINQKKEIKTLNETLEKLQKKERKYDFRNKKKIGRNMLEFKKNRGK